jgi:hypothetical protein
MKDKDLKKILQSNTESPDPAAKDAFIRKNAGAGRVRSNGNLRMILVQAGYIRKRVWVLTVLALTVGFFVPEKLDTDRVLVLATFMPFLGCLGMIEVFRSKLHGVYELEAATRFSAKGIFFARMTLILAVQIIASILISVFEMIGETYGVFASASILLIPLFVTTASCIIAERSGYGRDNPYCFAGIAAIVSMLHLLLVITGFYDHADIRFLVPVAALLFTFDVFEAVKTIRSEAVAWN